MVSCCKRFIASNDRCKVIFFQERLDCNRAVNESRVFSLVVFKSLDFQCLNLISRIAPKQVTHYTSSWNFIHSLNMCKFFNRGKVRWYSSCNTKVFSSNNTSQWKQFKNLKKHFINILRVLCFTFLFEIVMLTHNFSLMRTSK